MSDQSTPYPIVARVPVGTPTRTLSPKEHIFLARWLWAEWVSKTQGETFGRQTHPDDVGVPVMVPVTDPSIQKEWKEWYELEESTRTCFMALAEGFAFMHLMTMRSPRDSCSVPREF